MSELSFHMAPGRVKLPAHLSRYEIEAAVVTAHANVQPKTARKSAAAAEAAEATAARTSEGKRARNKREKHARIVRAARRLFREQGYLNTTTQQIAEAASIGSGTLFLYAKSKEDLLLLVFTTEMHALIERAFAGLDTTADPFEQVLALFKRFVAYHARDIDLAHQLIREITFLRHPERADELRAITHAIVDKLVLLLQRAVQRQQLRADTDLRLLGNCLFAIYYQQLQTWLSGFVTRRHFERTMASMLRYIVDGRRTLLDLRRARLAAGARALP